MTPYHVPVMRDEVIGGLRVKPRGVYLDCTLGGGGHAQALLEAAPDTQLVGIDKDDEALQYNRRLVEAFPGRVTLIRSDYADVAAVLDKLGIDRLDGAMLDAGVSSRQLDSVERGFSYSHDAPLDMRMDRTKSPTAADVVNTYDESALARILREYGEEPFAARIAKNIVAARAIAPLTSTAQLREIVERSVPPAARYGQGHPAKRTFQAIRIEVNGELVGLGDTVTTVCDRLASGGRMAVLTFHSLEDRIVKQAFRLMSTDCICPKSIPVCVCGHKASIRLVNPKPLRASEAELAQNPRAASAKLRIVEKL